MILTANSTGNFNTAGTWDSSITPGTIHASTSVSITTGGIDTTSFTAPNTTNAATGVWVYAATYPASGRDWTAELYESGVATGSIATILQTDMPTTAGWIYFRLATPYVFTTVVASSYKWRIKSTTANSGTAAADNTSTSLVFPIHTYDLTQAPTTADQCYIAPHNCTTTVTVTVDGTTGDIRGGSTTGQAATLRSTTLSLYIGGSLTNSKAVLKWDTAASATLTVGGPGVCTDGGELQMGTVASPYPASYTATYIARQGGGGTSTGFSQFTSSTGRIIMQGASRTYIATTYVSGTGVAASPLVVADAVDWNVGDRIAVTATSANATNYNETEYKYIITKNSSTSYVLSATSGGAESAFTYTHSTSAKVLLLTRNVIFTSTVQTQNFLTANSLVSGNIDFDWANLQFLGSGGGASSIALASSNNLYGFSIGVAGNAALAGVDNCVFNSQIAYGLIVGSTVAQTFTNNIFCQGTAGSASPICNGLGVGTAAVGHTFTNFYFVGNTKQAIEYRGVNCTFTNPYIVANNTAGTSSHGGFALYNGSPVTVTGADIHCNRIGGVALNGTAASTFTSCEIGTKGINQTSDVIVVANTANNILFNTTNVGSATLVSGHTGGAANATLVAFDTLNNTSNNHIWYTEYGSARSTGASLSDTTVRTSATLNVRIAPENSSTGFKYEYKVLAVPSKACSTLGFIQRNAAFGTDDCLVELFLPGSTSADASYTMPTTVGSYLVYNLAANYSGTLSRYATVRISAKTTTASAYVYVADIFNGTNNITNLTTWYKGQPSDIMFEQLGDAAAVWAVATSTLTTSGTTGKKLVQGLTTPKFLALK